MSSMGYDEMCHTCIHEEECAEVGGRKEGRGFGFECHKPGVQPQYERKNLIVPESLTPGFHGKRCLGNGEHEGYECCCYECEHFYTCFPEYSE